MAISKRTKECRLALNISAYKIVKKCWQRYTIVRIFYIILPIEIQNKRQNLNFYQRYLRPRNSVGDLRANQSAGYNMCSIGITSGESLNITRYYVNIERGFSHVRSKSFVEYGTAVNIFENIRCLKACSLEA